MRRVYSIALLLLVALGLSATTKEVKLKLVETSDIHGNFFPYNFIEQRELHMLQISSAADRKNMFYHEWTRRESYFKRCGQDDLPMSGIFREGIIRACGREYYYCISLPENDD